MIRNTLRIALLAFVAGAILALAEGLLYPPTEQPITHYKE